MKSKELFISSAILFLLCFSRAVHASDIQAASCSQADVQTAVNSASSGDRVLVPSGNCTWNSLVSIPSGEDITLEGAGSTKTHITGALRRIDIHSATRITGFWFTMTDNGGTAFAIQNTFVVFWGQNWRFDHNKIEYTGPVNALPDRGMCLTTANITYGMVPWPGLIDHNNFINCMTNVNGAVGKSNIQNVMNYIWQEPLGLGTGDAVFYEDNTFNETHAINEFQFVDCNRAGRYVVRHNDFENGMLDTHGLQDMSERSCRSYEIYDNTINTTQSQFRFINIRSATGVIYDNTITGPYQSTDVRVLNDRSFQIPHGGTVSDICDGTNAVDGNTAPTTIYYGWPCRDQVGRGRDQAGGYPQPQLSDPLYVWGNTLNGNAVGVKPHDCQSTYVPNGSCTVILANRDYIVGTPKPGYTAYTYPHPLPMARTGSALPPPTDLAVVVQ